MLDPDDHRSLIQRLDLCHFEDESPGMVHWHPRGYLRADRRDAHRCLRQVGGDRGVGHDHGDRGIAGDVAVVEAERIDDQPRLAVVVERQRPLHDGFGVAQRVLAEQQRLIQVLQSMPSRPRTVALGDVRS